MLIIKIQRNRTQIKKVTIIIFVVIFTDIFSNNEHNQIVTTLFIRIIKQNNYLVFISQFYVAVPKIRIVSLWKLQKNVYFSKFHLIIHQIIIIDRGVAKISPLSSRKIGKYEYLTGEEILPSDQRRGIE